jgi:hypothetical protein
MRKIIALTLAVSVLMGICAYAVCAEPLTEADNGIDGEITVKYGGKEFPLVLLGGQDMGLTVKISSDIEYDSPKMFAALYDGNRLKIVQIVNAVVEGGQYVFQSEFPLPDDITDEYLMKILLWEGEQTPISYNLRLIEILKPVIYTYDSNNRIETVAFGNLVTAYEYSDGGNLVSTTTVSAASMSMTNGFDISSFSLRNNNSDTLNLGGQNNNSAALSFGLQSNSLRNSTTQTGNETEIETNTETEGPELSDVIEMLISVEITNGRTYTTYNLEMWENDTEESETEDIGISGGGIGETE